MFLNWEAQYNIVEMSVLPELIYELNVIKIKGLIPLYSRTWQVDWFWRINEEGKHEKSLVLFEKED